MDLDYPAPIKPQNITKTYSKADKKVLKTPEDANTPVSLTVVKLPKPKREPLTTKNAVTFLLDGRLKSLVCRYCLNVTTGLSTLDQTMEVANKGSLYKVTIGDMIACFHPFKVSEDPYFPNKICEKCLDLTVSSYLFTQQCEQAHRALLNCFEDMNDKLNKLDPLEKTKRRGRQKLHPNYNVLHAEHENVMDYAEPLIHLINTGEPITPQAPIQEFECLKCCQILPNIESLLNHEQMHPKTMWYNCRLCGKSFPKLYLIKKHLRSEHTQDTETKVSEENLKYDCKKCGVVSVNYYEHLQHKEKHTFKMIMNHLLERKMDRLCAVCLDKGSNLSNLNEIVSLHGGSPELTGDKPLYSILAATLPENKNKYQELFVSTPASIINITVKKHHKTIDDFVLSAPIIVTDEDIDTEKFNYFFSQPLMLASLELTDPNTQNINIVSHLTMKKNSDILEQTKVKESEGIKEITATAKLRCPKAYNHIDENSADDIVIAITKNNLNSSWLNFKFSNPEYIKPDMLPDIVEKEISSDLRTTIDVTEEINDNTNTREVKDIPEESPINILKVEDPMLKNMENNDINTVISNDKKCNFCWVFKHLDKCDSCKFPVSKLNINETENKLEIPVYPKSDTQDKNIDENYNFMANPIKTLKKSWQCNVCLRNNNADTNSCSCCDSNMWNNIDNSFEFKNETISLKENLVSLNVNRSNSETEDTSTNIQYTDNVNTHPESQTVNDSINTMMQPLIQPNLILTSDTFEMETDNFIEDNPIQEESMEIEDIEDPQTHTMEFPCTFSNTATNMIVIPNESSTTNMIVIPNESSSNIYPPASQFQFTIGAGTVNRRKQLKAKRKGNLFHN